MKEYEIDVKKPDNINQESSDYNFEDSKVENENNAKASKMLGLMGDVLKGYFY